MRISSYWFPPPKIIVNPPAKHEIDIHFQHPPSTHHLLQFSFCPPRVTAAWLSASTLKSPPEGTEQCLSIDRFDNRQHTYCSFISIRYGIVAENRTGCTQWLPKVIFCPCFHSKLELWNDETFPIRKPMISYQIFSFKFFSFSYQWIEMNIPVPFDRFIINYPEIISQQERQINKLNTPTIIELMFKYINTQLPEPNWSMKRHSIGLFQRKDLQIQVEKH